MYGLFETGDMDATAPRDVTGERYVGNPVDKDGKLRCPVCGKLFSECTCNKEDLHTSDIPDDKQGLLMGNPPQASPEDNKRRKAQEKESKTGKDDKEEKNEVIMDFLNDLDTLLLEEYLEKPETSSQTSELTETKPSTFTEQFEDYMKRHGDNIDRKPSDGPLKATNGGLKQFYGDHFLPKNIR